MMNASTWAESAWGAENVNDQAEAMEVLFGTFMVGFGAMSLTAAFVLKGTAQGTFAVFNGGVMIAFFLLMFVMLNSTGYNMPGVAFLIPPFILLGGLSYSGFLHMTGDETSTEA
jgi:peptidoglycan/LPS O-acetylase OafA/YrhL